MILSMNWLSDFVDCKDIEIKKYCDRMTDTGSKVEGYQNGQLTVTCGDETKKLACDSVILAVGYKEEDELYKQLEFEVPEIYLLGDAKKVSNIMYAIWDAFEVANHI